MHKSRKTYFLTAIFGFFWIAAVAVGLSSVSKYESTAGATAVAPEVWPAASHVEPAIDRSTLVMVAHPLCPCTRASIAELEQIMAEAQGKLKAYVLFLKPTNSGAGWDNTGLWQSASAIPGVTAIADVDGAEAHRFGAETSGHTLLFAANGQLLFHGGITQARGHAGDNYGETAILALADNRSAVQRTTPTFGCPLFRPVAASLEVLCRK